MKKIVPDTNLYIDWINRGLREDVMLGAGLVRYMSAVVLMELRVGAHTRAGRSAIDRLTRSYSSARRLVAPSSHVFEKAGSALRRLRLAGRDVRSASFLNDVLIALTAQALGATMLTANVADFEAIRSIEPFALEAA